MTKSSIVSVLAQVLVVLAALGGFVSTLLHHGDTTGYLSAVLPILGGLGIVARLESRSDRQDAALATITHQTNGVLTARIKSAVADALADLTGSKPEAPDVPAPAPDATAASADVAPVEPPPPGAALVADLAAVLAKYQGTG